MKHSDCHENTSTGHKRITVGSVLKDTFKIAAGGVVGVLLAAEAVVGMNYIYHLHEQAKPTSSDLGQANPTSFAEAVLAMPEAGERMRDVRAGYVSGHYDASGMMVRVYRDAPDLIADYYDALAQRVKNECRYGNVNLCPAPLKNSVASAFAAHIQSERYTAWEGKRQLALQRALVQEPLFWPLRERWPNLNKDQKLQTLRYVATMQAKMYSDDTLHLSTPHVREAVLPTNTAGTYNTRTNTIKIFERALTDYTFDQAMELIGHEGGHHIHAGLVDLSKTSRGRDYLRTQGILADVRMFSLTLTRLNMDRSNAEGGVGPSHDFVPDERDADNIGADVSIAAINAQAGMLAPRRIASPASVSR